jgi:hypothetical protein
MAKERWWLTRDINGDMFIWYGGKPVFGDSLWRGFAFNYSGTINHVENYFDNLPDLPCGKKGIIEIEPLVIKVKKKGKK